MKTFICLILCLLVFAGCEPKSSTDTQEELKQRLDEAYKKYKSGELKLKRFSEIK